MRGLGEQWPRKGCNVLYRSKMLEMFAITQRKKSTLNYSKFKTHASLNWDTLQWAANGRSSSGFCRSDARGLSMAAMDPSNALDRLNSICRCPPQVSARPRFIRFSQTLPHSYLLGETWNIPEVRGIKKTPLPRNIAGKFSVCHRHGRSRWRIVTVRAHRMPLDNFKKYGNMAAHKSQTSIPNSRNESVIEITTKNGIKGSPLPCPPITDGSCRSKSG